MPRFSVRPAFVLALTLALVAALTVGLSPRGTVAQDATPAPLAGHPIVGTWLLMNATDPPSPSTASFAADGSVVVESVVNYKDPTRGVVYASDLVGTWEPIGARGVHLTAVAIETDADGAYSGTTTLDAYPVVAADGQTWTDDGTQVKVTVRDAANVVVATLGGGGSAEPITPPVVATRMRPGALVFPPMPAAATPCPACTGGRAPATPAP